MAPAVAAHELRQGLAVDRPSRAAGSSARRCCALRKKVTSEADYVGDKFAEEARKIHFKEVDPRGIYGEATRDEVAALVEDGVDFMPLPHVPEEAN